MPAKAVYLIAPGYRRWLTPDATELVFETEGFEAKDAKNWQARLIVSDLDGGAEATSTFPIDLSRKTFSLPVPKFHRRAEIILFIENPRDREPVCEGRWRLTNIPKEELAGLNYFDSRGVFFHEGVGRFPIIAWPERPVQTAKLDSFSKAGYSGLVLASSKIDEAAIARVEALKLMLFPHLDLDATNPIESIQSEVKRLRSFRCVAGYVVMFAKDESLRSQCLAACRRTDPSRPAITLVVNSAAARLPADLAEFEDVLLMEYIAPRAFRPRPLIGKSRMHFAFTTDDESSSDLRKQMLIAASHSASAFVISGKERRMTAVDYSATIDNALPLVNAVVRGVPEPSDDSTEGRWFWRRKLPNGLRAVIEVERGDPPTATFSMDRVGDRKSEP